MNVEELRDYCLSLGTDVEEKMPFQAFKAANGVLAFYVCGHMFCYFDIDRFEVISLKCQPERIGELKECHTSVTAPYNMNPRHWIGLLPEAGDDLTRALVRNSYEIVKQQYTRKKNMKRTSVKMIALMAVAAMGFAACSGGNKPVDNNDSLKPAQRWNGISVCSENDCVEVIGLQDREGEQAVELFRGSYNDALLDTLLAPGQTAFRSAFNVYIARGRADYDDTVDHTILFDAGIGPQAGGRLLDRMKVVDITPADIEAVCLTHLHFDHLGWLLDEEGKVTFPNADIYLSEAEMASGKDNERWQQVLAAYGKRVKTFVDGETICYGMVTPCVVSGHTPGHTIYEVGPCLIVGDLLHAQDLQLEHPDFCARYDADPASAVRGRKNTYHIIRRSGLYLCGAHCYEHFIQL